MIYKYILSFKKIDIGKFIGHLDTQNVFIRTLKISGVKLNFGEGSKPKPKISFIQPLPLGIEAINDLLYFETIEEIQQDKINKIKKTLPLGFSINKIVPVKYNGKWFHKMKKSIDYLIVYNKKKNL